MVLAKVLARGQITIPREVREQVHLLPGDLVRIEPVGKGKFVVEVIPTLTLDEILQRYRSEDTILDFAKLRTEGETEAANEVITKLAQQGEDRE